ncbi:MAG: type II toxin-antitoxin system RelE/ParE family toxin [Spirochaetaceae bacterium]|jgi:phage-related protein|nr:type II toxin-antitoxin system RelE/ParE family toxin [Spirochaetaceae bacterium]
MVKKWKAIYYPLPDGSRPVQEFIHALPENESAKVYAWITELENKGPNLPRPYAAFLEDGIHELRVKITGTQERILYFFCFQNQIVLTNNFEKHSQTVPKSEIRLAKKRREDFLKRFPNKQEDYP